ncbi:unnamed protein product [Pleuronectes platessa]|uniref:Uncharacterized protein n=1 Tax=Pleuronectes platessa TaxID=8262 RepID=A0A9N7VXF1_PLEPL|nr:unnamed protein product [Pleuronectes platessa]
MRQAGPSCGLFDSAGELGHCDDPPAPRAFLHLVFPSPTCSGRVNVKPEAAQSGARLQRLGGGVSESGEGTEERGVASWVTATPMRKTEQLLHMQSEGSSYGPSSRDGGLHMPPPPPPSPPPFTKKNTSLFDNTSFLKAPAVETLN